MKVTHRHMLNIPKDKVIGFYTEDDFYEAKLRNSGALTIEIVEKEELPGNKLRKKVKVSEKSRLPSFIRKNDVDNYTDDNILDLEAGTLTWKVTPSMMANKFKLSGKVEFHARGEDRCELVFNTAMEVKIPLIGRKAEKIGLKNTEEEVKRQVDFIKKWNEGK